MSKRTHRRLNVPLGVEQEPRKFRSAITKSCGGGLVCWRFSSMDMGGPFSFANVGGKTWKMLLARMKEWERMTWDELAGRRDHAIEVASLSPEAQRRLQEIGMDDIDEVFSLHLDGRRRLIGIRDERVFRLLWWDPEHKACPSMKKHT